MERVVVERLWGGERRVRVRWWTCVVRGRVREMGSRGVRGVAWCVGNREFGIRGMGSVRGLMCRPSPR